MALVASASPALAPAPAGALRRLRFGAFGTTCDVQYPSEGGGAAAFEAAAVAWVRRFQARYTRFREDSLIGQINARAGTGEWLEVDEEMERMLEVCAALHTFTAGILDVTAAPLARLWDYRNPQPRLPAAGEIAAARRLVGWLRVERRPGLVRLPERGMALDFGGWGKEYAVDAIADLAREHGLMSLLVDFGHDLRASGPPPARPAWHVGLEDPDQPGRSVGSIAVTHQAVAASGDYLRGFTLGGRRYGHIVDPRTGEPATSGCRQVTVVAPTCLMAGVLATTAFVLGPAEGVRLVQDSMGAEARIVAAGAVYQTRGFYRYVVA